MGKTPAPASEEQAKLQGTRLKVLGEYCHGQMIETCKHQLGVETNAELERLACRTCPD